MRTKKDEITYRVYKMGGLRCIRKFASLDDAWDWCILRESGPYRIEWQYPDELTPRSTYV